MRRLLVWGAGGHAAVVADLLLSLGYDLAGFVAAEGTPVGTTVMGFHEGVVVSDQALRERFADGRRLEGLADSLVLGIGNNHIRGQIAGMLTHEELPILVHPSAIVSERSTIGIGTVLLATAVVNARAQIGRGVIVNTGAIVEHDAQVGDAVHLSPRSTLCGGVTVGREAWIGAGAVVIPGKQVGIGAVVGAGSVVIRNVPEGARVAGSPARPIRTPMASPDPRSA